MNECGNNWLILILMLESQCVQESEAKVFISVHDDIKLKIEQPELCKTPALLLMPSCEGC